MNKTHHKTFPLSGIFDSGLLVVVCIILVLLTSVFSFLLLVEYEWCEVLFKNNTVSWNIILLILCYLREDVIYRIKKKSILRDV